MTVETPNKRVRQIFLFKKFKLKFCCHFDIIDFYFIHSLHLISLVFRTGRAQQHMVVVCQVNPCSVPTEPNTTGITAGPVATDFSQRHSHSLYVGLIIYCTVQFHHCTSSSLSALNFPEIILVFLAVNSFRITP